MASDPTTWAELRIAVQDWIGGEVDLSGNIPEFIALAERRFSRELRVPSMEAVASITVDAETESLPADFLEIRAVYLTTDPKTVLEYMTLADLRNTYSANATGKPQNYSIQSGDTLVFGPSPDSSYTAKVNYYQSITALSGSQATNWLLTDHPDVYLAAALAEAFAFLSQDRPEAVEKALMWEAKAQGKLAAVMNADRRRNVGSAPVRIRAPQVV